MSHTKIKHSLSILLCMALILTLFMPVTADAASKTKISLSKSTLSMKATKTATLTLKNGSKKVTGGVAWSSSDKSVASVSKGKITAKNVGKATISAKYKGKTYKCKVTVKAPSYKISNKKASLKKGAKTTLYLKEGSKKITKNVKWSSSDKAVATVTQKGIVKAKKAGKAVITAESFGKKYKCNITVTEDKPQETPANTPSETPSNTPSETPSETPQTARDYNDEVSVTYGEKEIYIEFEYNNETTSKEELEAEGFTVNGGTASKTTLCDTATFTFNSLPQSYDEIRQLSLKDSAGSVDNGKFRPMAAAIAALSLYEEMGADGMYSHPMFEIMDYLNGPKLEISNAAKSGVYYSMKATLAYGKLAYFDGAKPSNAYEPNKPYTFTLVESPYYIPAKESTIAHPEGEPERRMILISFEGDDSQRYVDVYKSGDGNWYTYDNSWQHLIASMKTPVTSAW